MIDWKKVGERVRGLLGVVDELQLARTAERLKVDEASLRAIALRSPSPADIRALAAITRVYGLDPTWVLTGRYDSASHRTALSADTSEMVAILQRKVTEASHDDDSPRAR
jgi:hypothetical protein